jgi:hypothetical protein
MALAAFRADPPGLVTACRRVVSRQPTSGPLWWLCARTLTAGEPMVEAWSSADEIDADATCREVAHALPDGATVCVLGWPELAGDALARRGDLEVLVVDVFDEGSGLVRRLLQGDAEAEDVPLTGLARAVAASDVLLLETSCAGPDGAVAVVGSYAAAAVARQCDVDTWLVAGVGRVVPDRFWEVVAARVVDDEPWDCEDDIVPLELVDSVARPRGLVTVDQAVARPDCPVAAELLREL